MHHIRVWNFTLLYGHCIRCACAGGSALGGSLRWVSALGGRFHGCSVVRGACCLIVVGAMR